MKLAALLLLLPLCACEQPHKVPTLNDKVGILMEQRKLQLAGVETNRQFTLAADRAALEEAQIENQTKVLRARASAEVNKIIEASISDKEALKRWTPEGTNVTSPTAKWVCGSNTLCYGTSSSQIILESN